MDDVTEPLKDREIERLRREALRSRERYTMLCSLLSHVLLQPAWMPFLSAVADSTRRLTDARYAAVLLTDEGGHVRDFAYHGLSEQEAHAIGSSPHGLGILGWVQEQRRAVRLDNLNRHPRAVGFPRHHPAMHAFVGAPLRAEETVVGILIATKAPGAGGFSEEDESLLEIFADQLGIAVLDWCNRSTGDRTGNEPAALAPIRDDVLGMMSHELRSPLALIKTAVEWMRLEGEFAGTSAACGEALDTIERQTERILGTVNGLVDMTQLEAGALSVRARASDLRDLLTEIQKGSPHREGPGLILEVPSVVPKVHMDRRRIKHVVEALLTNAVAHGHKDDPIRIRVEPGQDQVIVEVHSRGRGISSDEIPRFFSESSADREGGVRSHGVRLELEQTLCKGIVEAHGGRIWANSSTTTGATTFAFTLPVAADAAESLPAVTKRSHHLGKVGRPGERARIIAIDDEPQILRYLQRTLANAGYHPIVTDDPAVAAEMVEAEDPDLVILDLVFPGGDGLKALKEIREISGVPVLFLSAVDGDAIVQALQSGADDYITKPFSPSELLARVEASLRCRVLPDQVEVRPTYHAEGITIDFKDRRVSLHGVPVTLSATEYKLLFQLAANAGRVLTNQELLQRVWGPEYSGESHLLRSFVRNLRKKLGDDARSPKLIFTERGIGYRLREG